MELGGSRGANQFDRHMMDFLSGLESALQERNANGKGSVQETVLELYTPFLLARLILFLKWRSLSASQDLPSSCGCSWAAARAL
jgi:hypothetical protein